MDNLGLLVGGRPAQTSAFISGCISGSHEGGLALLQVVAFGPRSRLAAETHDEAALVDEVAGDVHGQQEEHERHHQDAGPQHDAHGERRFVVHVCRIGSGKKDGSQHREPRSNR